MIQYKIDSFEALEKIVGPEMVQRILKAAWDGDPDWFGDLVIELGEPDLDRRVYIPEWHGAMRAAGITGFDIDMDLFDITLYCYDYANPKDENGADDLIKIKSP